MILYTLDFELLELSTIDFFLYEVQIFEGRGETLITPSEEDEEIVPQDN